MPGQFFELEALINNCKDQRKRGPQRSQPAVGCFVPSEKRKESSRRERMKKGDGTDEALFRRGFAREEV